MKSHTDQADVLHPSGSPDALGPDISRRRFVGAGGALSVFSGLALTPGAASAASPLEAYASRSSARPGQVINFHVRDPGGSLTADTVVIVTIVRLAGWVDLTVQTGSLAVRNQPVPADVVTAGCGWPVSWSLTVPANWPSGIYYAFFLGATGSGCCVPFIVRPVGKTAGVRVLVQVPVTTAQAINNYGGKSVEESTRGAADNSVKVSFDRPFAYRFNYAFDAQQASLARWLNRVGIKADFCSSVDAHVEPDLLSGYTLVVTAGYDAYWTNEVRARFDNFIATGGNAALLGARHCANQVRLEPSPRTGISDRVVVFYGDPFTDPETRPDFKAVQWSVISPARSSEVSVGLISIGGPTFLGTGPRPPTPAVVQVPHWIFEGTGLKPGDAFGADVMGPLLDGGGSMRVPGLFRDPALAGQCPVSTRVMSVGNDFHPVPPQLTLLTNADANAWPPTRFSNGQEVRQGSGQMGIFSRGSPAGTVFNAGTADWVLGLRPELQGLPANAVGRMTRNVITRLSSGTHNESAEVRVYRAGQPQPRDRYELSIGEAHTLTTYTATYQRGYLGRAYVNQVPGTVPVYRFSYSDPNQGILLRYRYTIAPQSVGAGWVKDGIVFWVFATAVANSEPIYAHYAIGNPFTFPRDAAGWRFFYSRYSQLPEPLECDPDGVNWTLAGVAWYAPTI